MKFLIITNAPHKIKDGKYYAYGPYIKEMNIWLKHVDEVKVISFVSTDTINNMDLAYKHNNIEFISVPTFNLTSMSNIFKTLVSLPIILYTLFKYMKKSDHIHLRSPSNMALLGLIVQVFFPNKKKTAKYAANWDMTSKQPLSYRLQQKLMENTFLSRNLKALVYGEWPNQTNNIFPMFTATYHDDEKEKINIRPINGKLNIIYSGRLIKSKRPLLTIQVVEELINRGYDAYLDVVGDGEEMNRLRDYVKNHSLSKNIILHGRENAETLKILYKKAHFLVFMSKSEGWGKVITESMFWGCLPITTAVGPVPYILGNGSRGALLEANKDIICDCIEKYIDNPSLYLKHTSNAIAWSQELTLDKFEQKIKELLYEKN